MMKNIEFTGIYLENFGKHREPIQTQLGKKTLISGANATGKSTLKRMFQWILGTRDENGKEITGIRPHDENGVDIDGLVTTAEVGVSVDGMENTLKKTYFQKKNRQGEYTGENDTQYFIDDVRKNTKKSYDEFVSGFLPAMVCISAQEFFSKDTAGRREMLSIFSNHTDDDVIADNPEFEELRANVKANSVSDLKKACRDRQKALTKKRDEVVTEIRVKEGDKTNLDFAELELQKKSLEEQIAENEAKQADILKEISEREKESDGVLQLKFKLSDLERIANEELEEKRREIRTKRNALSAEIDSIFSKIRLLKNDIEGNEMSIERNESLKKKQQDLWRIAKNRVFDENSLVCAYCGQEYPEEKKEEIRAKFDTEKAEELKSIIERGLELKADIEKGKAEIEKLKVQFEESEKSKSELITQINELETQYNAIPESIDISDREDVKEITRQIAEKESAMKEESSVAGIRQDLLLENTDLRNRLVEVEKQLSLAKKNVEIDETVESLRKKKMEISQEIVDVDRELDLLKQFEREKARLLEEDLNANCEYIRFKMSELQQNGELRDICKITVDGEDYDRNLNFSSKLLAEIDVCRMFQRKYGVQLPILLDNAESINDFRLPDIPNQMIIFRCTDEPELTIKNVR